MSFSKIVLFFLNFLDYFQQKKIIKLINQKFKDPIVVFDIGAHHGETVKVFLKKLKIKKIYSFEASPLNFKILSKKTNKYSKEKVEIFDYGMGDTLSESYINQTLETSSSTINDLNKESKYFKRKLKILNIRNQDSFIQKIPIKLSTLDHFIEKKDIEFIDLLKIDTEGYEFNVIKGLSKYRSKIKLIYFEYHYDDMIVKNYKFGDIHSLLKSQNFMMISKSKMLFRKSFEYVYENKYI